MSNYLPGGCTDEMCSSAPIDAEEPPDEDHCDICGTVFTSDECPECADTDWARRNAAEEDAGDRASDYDRGC